MTTIYISLLNEGTDTWAPFDAEHVRDDIYRIVGSRNDVEARFTTGSLVRCEMRNLSGGDCLVAVEKIG